MSISKNETIEILQAGNGFIVRPGNDSYDRGCVRPITDSLVFQSFAELTAWLDLHFSHRCSSLEEDEIIGLAQTKAAP